MVYRLPICADDCYCVSFRCDITSLLLLTQHAVHVVIKEYRRAEPSDQASDDELALLITQRVANKRRILNAELQRNSCTTAADKIKIQLKLDESKKSSRRSTRINQVCEVGNVAELSVKR